MRCVDCKAKVPPGPVRCPYCQGGLEVTAGDIQRWLAFGVQRRVSAAGRWGLGITGLVGVMVAGSHVDGEGARDAGEAAFAALTGGTTSSDLASARSGAEPGASPARITLASTMAKPVRAAPAALRLEGVDEPLTLRCEIRCVTLSDMPIGYAVNLDYNDPARAAHVAADGLAACELTGGAALQGDAPDCAPNV